MNVGYAVAAAILDGAAMVRQFAPLTLLLRRVVRGPKLYISRGSCRRDA